MAREGNWHGLGCFVEYRRVAGGGCFRAEAGKNRLPGCLLTDKHHRLCCQQRDAHGNVLPGDYAPRYHHEADG